MICKDLDEFYEKINLSIMEGKIDTKITWSKATILKPISAVIEENKCTLKFENLGYKEEGKIKHLERTYLEKDGLKEFFESGQQVYYFPCRKVELGKRKPNCLLFTQYVKQRKEYIIVWRTAEFFCRMGADLLFINKHFPKDARLRLIFLEGYQFIEVAPGIFELNNWEIKETGGNGKYIEKFKDFSKRHFPDVIGELNNWDPIGFVQREVKNKRSRKGGNKYGFTST